MLEFEGSIIQVGVRLRPMIFFDNYNRQETDKGCKRVVQIEDSTTISVTNPEDATDKKIFGFTQCYWSYDGFLELQDGHFVPDSKHPNGSKFCDQKRLFDNFGKEIIQNAWSGYNSTFLSYGETGSGKSWSLIGNNINKGIIPLLSMELFKSIRDKEKGLSQSQLSGSSIEVKFTMIEIYDDKIRDLLFGNNYSTKYKHAIKIREHPKRGFYVEGIRSATVASTEEFQQRFDEGIFNRALASTTLNLISSQATVVIGLSLVQKYRNSKGDEQTMSAFMDFYDLPGSEFPSNEYRNEESALQNKSIKILRACVDGLINSSIIGGKCNAVPFKESTVTKLLQRALSGNSKSYVLGTLSPSDSNYEETILTLTFADKIQRLKTNPIVNEEQTNKLTRELKIENENLKKMLTSGDLERNEFFAWTEKLDLSVVDTDDYRKQIIEDIKSQMRDNEREIKALSQLPEEKLKLGKLEKFNETFIAAKKLETDKKSKPYIYNLTSDCQLSRRITYVLSPGTVDFGSFKGKDNFLVITGIGIHEQHGTFTTQAKDNKTLIKPSAPDCLICVNGQQILFETSLFHNDRIALGGCQIWIFQNPKDPWADKNAPSSSRLTFQFCQEEIASKSTFFCNLTENGPVSLKLKDDIIKLTPFVADANAMSEDLEKEIHFDLVMMKDINRVLNSELFDLNDDFDFRQIMIKVLHFKEDIEFFWPKEKFVKRFGQMKALYVQMQDDGLNNGLQNPTADPFTEDIDTEVPIGCSLVSLKPLAYLIEEQQSVEVMDFLTLNKPIGSIKVEISPSTEFFEKLNDSQVFLSKPEELLGKPLHFYMKIGSSENFPGKYKDIYCKYKFYDELMTSTGKLDSKSSYVLGSLSKYERRFSIGLVTPKLLDYLERELLVLSFFGKQRPKKMRNLFKSEYKFGNPGGEADVVASYLLGDHQKQSAELNVFKKLQVRLQEKLDVFNSLVEYSEDLDQNSIPISYIKRICDSKTQESAAEALSEFREEFKPPEDIEPVRKLTTYQKVSEVCCIA